MIDIKIKNAITSFEHWGNIKPSTANGHAIIASAFHEWSNGGLALYACEPSNCATMYYACLPTKPKGEPLFIHWREGICNTKADGDKCFHTDTKNKVNSWYSYYTTIQKVPSKYPELTTSLRTHLEKTLGSFKFQDFDDWFKPIVKKLSPVSSYVYNTHQPWSIKKLAQPTWSEHSACYQRITSQNIWSEPIEAWPPALSADELVHFLMNAPIDNRPSVSEYVQQIQEYTELYPMCVWTREHTTQWVTKWSTTDTDTITPDAIKTAFFEYDSGWHKKPNEAITLPDWIDYLRIDIAIRFAHKQHANNHQDIAWLVEQSTDPRKLTFEYPQTALGGQEAVPEITR